LPVSPNQALLPGNGAAVVYASVDPDADATLLAQDGYVRIGISSFKAFGHVTFDQIRDQARKVGADIVLFSESNPGSRQALPPQVFNDQGASLPLASYVHLSGSVSPFGGNYGGTGSVGGGTMEFNGKVTSSGIPGVSSADLEAMNAQPYEYTAMFWRKLQRGAMR